MMDPMFGLPCIRDSRAMDHARNRNFMTDKILAQKVESIDLARKSASGKHLTIRSDVEDFRESLDYNTSKCTPHVRRTHCDKKVSTGSMSLKEFDKIINEAKDRKHNPASSSATAATPFTASAKASNPNSFILRKESTVLLHSFDADSSRIVDLEQYERCLPINRQKHAMRDAWERATTDDIHFKKHRAQPKTHSPSSHSSVLEKGRERFYSYGDPQPTQTGSNSKQSGVRRKRTV